MATHSVDAEKCLADSELAHRIKSFLLQRQVPGLRHVGVSADHGTVTLSGRLETFYQKQLCLSCSQRVAGVVKLVDRLEVA